MRREGTLRVVIVGAGLAGLSAAHALLARGVRPTVIAPDHGMSARGAGILSAQFADEGRVAMARRSREIVRALVPVHVCGHAQIATTLRGARQLDGLSGVRDSLPAELEAALAPAFRRRILRAVFAEDDFWIDVRRLLRVLGAGATFVNARVRSIRGNSVVTDRGVVVADRVLLALGRWSDGFVPDLSRRESARVAHLRVALPAMFHVVESGFYARPDGNGAALGGDGSLTTIRREAARVFGRKIACVGAGGGEIHATRDGIPLVKQVDETTWMVAGLGGDGLSLGPALGELVADRLME